MADSDLRAQTAQYYDLDPDFPPDVPFYLARLGPGPTRVLELGCGTGRVTVPLAQRCSFLHGVDLSPAMAALCQRRAREAGVSTNRATVTVGDITDLSLGSTFNLIVAPFRVFHESDAAVAGFFRTIRHHLAPLGRCILNTFRPIASPEEILARWRIREESLDWEVETSEGRTACFVRRGRVVASPLILYPELVYRRYQGLTLIHEISATIPMRCWYPDELVKLIQAEGFVVQSKWGGYMGEPYGEGSELVVSFAGA